MKKFDERFVTWPLLCACLALMSCHGPTEPIHDTTPPVADLRLSLWRADSSCPCIAIFSVNPVGSSDDRTERNALQVRWDFDNDGKWDTDYEGLDIKAYDPQTLPVGTWTARCEVRDLAGNTDIQVSSMPLPAWLPVPSDIIAGTVRWRQAGCGCAANDTLTAGQAFDVVAYRQDWTAPAGQHLTTALYIDGVLISEAGALTELPDRGSCGRLTATVAGGIATPGLHEIKVVVDSQGEIVETDESNNTTTSTVVVIAP